MSSGYFDIEKSAEERKLKQTVKERFILLVIVIKMFTGVSTGQGRLPQPKPTTSATISSMSISQMKVPQLMAKGKSLYSKQKYAEAFPYLDEAAIRGDKDAQRYMGEYYRPGVPQHRTGKHDFFC